MTRADPRTDHETHRTTVHESHGQVDRTQPSRKLTLHQVVLSKMPVPHPEQLVLITSPGDLKNGRSADNDSGGMDYIFNWRTFRELEKHTEAAAVAGFRAFPSTIAFTSQT